jgi:hypothetical protein
MLAPIGPFRKDGPLSPAGADNPGSRATGPSGRTIIAPNFCLCSKTPFLQKDALQTYEARFGSARAVACPTLGFRSLVPE